MDMEREIVNVIASYLINKKVGEKKAKELAISYASYLGDLPLAVINAVLKEKGLMETPKEFRTAVINKGIIMALREILYAIERMPSGSGAIRFSDPKVPEFIRLMGGMSELRRMSVRDIQINLYKLYPELPSTGETVYDIEPGRESYLFIDFPKRLKKTVQDVKELKGIGEGLKELKGVEKKGLKPLKGKV